MNVTGPGTTKLLVWGPWSAEVYKLSKFTKIIVDNPQGWVQNHQKPDYSGLPPQLMH